jgi:hypothetical protein
MLFIHLGLWVSSEKLCADLLVKNGVRDGITKELEDTCDGLPFE